MNNRNIELIPRFYDWNARPFPDKMWYFDQYDIEFVSNVSGFLCELLSKRNLPARIRSLYGSRTTEGFFVSDCDELESYEQY